VTWTSLRVVPTDHREAVLAALFATGVVDGVHEDGDSLVTHLAPGIDVAPVVAAVRQVDRDARVDSEPLADVDWSTAWRERIRAHELGAIRIAPPWLAANGAGTAAHTIVIEPAMAFGTGEHATTRGMVRLLQRFTWTDRVVADLGAGSAVLSIAAARLGARRVAAIELDPDAIANAEANVVANDCADAVAVIQGDAALLLPLLAPVDGVLANIISSVLRELLPVIADAVSPGAPVMLGGMLVDERAAMRDFITTHGWRVVADDEEDQWWSAAITRA
jgi:ribosomal protein L11 methyltransferase